MYHKKENRMKVSKKLTLLSLFIALQALCLQAENKQQAFFKNEYGQDVVVDCTWTANSSFAVPYRWSSYVLKDGQDTTMVKSPVSGYRLTHINVTPATNVWGKNYTWTGLMGTGALIGGVAGAGKSLAFSKALPIGKTLEDGFNEDKKMLEEAQQEGKIINLKHDFENLQSTYDIVDKNGKTNPGSTQVDIGDINNFNATLAAEAQKNRREDAINNTAFGAAIGAGIGALIKTTTLVINKFIDNQFGMNVHRDHGFFVIENNGMPSKTEGQNKITIQAHHISHKDQEQAHEVDVVVDMQS